MGFMGLSSWVDSDGAADFRYVLQKQFEKFAKYPPGLKRAVREVVDLELADMANEYNTPGMVNLALCIEAEGESTSYDEGLPVFSHLLSTQQLTRASQLFVQETPKWKGEFHSRIKELHTVITEALKAKRKPNP
jgi:hypothetical protein